MIQLTPQMRVLVAIEPVDFRRGVDGLAQQCRAALAEDPFSGAVFVFRNRQRTAVKLLVYDGQGFWAGLQVCGFERLELGEVDVQTPETMRRGGFRPAAYPRSKLLQTDGGLCHPAPASLLTWSASGRAPLLGGRYPASSLLRTHPPGSRLRRTSPFGSRGYLASEVFHLGARSPSLFQPMSLCACRRLYPAERPLLFDRPRSGPTAFADIVLARRSEPF